MMHPAVARLTGFLNAFTAVFQSSASFYRLEILRFFWNFPINKTKSAQTVLFPCGLRVRRCADELSDKIRWLVVTVEEAQCQSPSGLKEAV